MNVDIGTLIIEYNMQMKDKVPPTSLSILELFIMCNISILW